VADWKWSWLFHCPNDEVGLDVVDAREGEDRVEVEVFVGLEIWNDSLQQKVGTARDDVATDDLVDRGNGFFEARCPAREWAVTFTSMKTVRPSPSFRLSSTAR